MIRVSTRGRYALLAMVDLALHGGEGTVRRQDIADRQEISANYIAQLFRELRAAGLVDGVKGPGGGYRLARDAHTISAGDVVRAVEGPVALASCAAPDSEPTCSRVGRCPTHALWRRLSAALTELLDSATLQELCDEAREPGQAEG